MEISKIMFTYLRFSLGETQVSDAEKTLDEEQLRALYTFAKRHDLVAMLADALDRNGVLQGDEEVKKKFLLERNKAVFRYEQMQYELDCLCEVLKDANIPFIPLKGAIIRPFYPQPWMRTSCDIDVLVNGTDLQQSIAVLKEKLGYRCDSVGEYDAQLFAENGVHLELHFNLTESIAKEEEKQVFQRVWADSYGDTCHRKMSDATFYCYHVSHIAKHLQYGGCGARAILDTWILNKRISHDRAMRETLLSEAGLLTLAKAIEKLSEVWFSEKDGDELSSTLGEFILTGGVYGTFDNKVAAMQTRKKSKIGYIFSRLFLPYSQLKYKYPKLQKYPILYPFYTVKRWFLLLKKGERGLALRELNQTANGDAEGQTRVVNLFRELGLSPSAQE